MPPITALDLITDAYLEAAIIEAGEVLGADDAAFGLNKLNRLSDSFNAEELNLFATDFLQFTLVPSVQPLTIGQAAVITKAELTGSVAIYTAKNSFKLGQYVDIAGCINTTFNVTNALVIQATPTNFQVNNSNADIAPQNQTTALAVFTGNGFPNFAISTQRPEKILNANIILNNVTPNVRVPLNIRDGNWWMSNPVPKVATTIPTDLYYSANWPNGQIFLWPMQSTAYGLELEVAVNLADISDVNYPFFLPQGYRDAITYGLAESLCPSYGVAATRVLMLAEAFRRSKALIQGANSSSPSLITRDSGIPGGSHRGTTFNWLSGVVK